jgi:hypothetical protein
VLNWNVNTKSQRYFLCRLVNYNGASFCSNPEVSHLAVLLVL